MNTNELKMNDDAINHLAKLLQMAILTGTDIMDNLRSATFVVHNDELHIHPDYHEAFEQNIQNMMSALATEEEVEEVE